MEVSVGDVVEEGQVVMILEAMKMQNEIQAPVAGTVTEIHCEEGQSIEANVPLLVITPPESEDEKITNNEKLQPLKSNKFGDVAYDRKTSL